MYDHQEAVREAIRVLQVAARAEQEKVARLDRVVGGGRWPAGGVQEEKGGDEAVGLGADLPAPALHPEAGGQDRRLGGRHLVP